MSDKHTKLTDEGRITAGEVRIPRQRRGVAALCVLARLRNLASRGVVVFTVQSDWQHSEECSP